MARPSLEVGEWGKIGYSWKGDRVRAYALYRFEDGTTSKRERWGADEDEARRELIRYLKTLSGKNDMLTTSSTFADVAHRWLAVVHEEEKFTTYRRYRACVTNQLVPLIGNLKLSECKPSRLQKAIDKIRKDYSDGTARLARAVLHRVFKYAILEDLMDADPATHLNKIVTNRQRIRAFDSDELHGFFDAVDADKYMRRSYIPDLLRFIFGTGVRIGEALAVRWQELNLTDQKIKVTHPVFGDRTLPPHSVWINGNIVHGEHSALIRHDGKTDTTEGILYLPPFLVAMLLFRMPQDVVPSDPVFLSPRGGYRGPNAPIKSIKALCARIGYPDVTSKWGRKTVGTYLTEHGQRGNVRNQLRHADEETADRHYIVRVANKEASEALERLFSRKPE